MSTEHSAALALRRMAGAGVICLAAGLMLLCTAFDLADDLHRLLGYPGLRRTSLIAAGAGLAILCGVAFVRALVDRERARPGGDPATAALVSLVVVPLAVVALGGYAHTHPPDKRMADPTLPYAFEYPGAWEPDPPEDLPATGASYIAGVSKQVETSVTEGVLVQVYEYAHPERLSDFMRSDLEDRGGTVVSQTRTTVDGRPAFRIDAEMAPDEPFGAQILVVDGRVVYSITCIFRENPERGRAGCQKVLDTFEIRARWRPRGGRGRGAPAA